MKKLKLKWLIIIGVVAALILLLFANFLYHSGSRPDCNRAIDGAFQQWSLTEYGRTNIFYPNANGNGSNSLAQVERYMGKEIQRYGYVPGLSFNDSDQLVLMYLKTKTHYTWHADYDHNISSPLRWMVVSPNIVFSGHCPEGGELLDTPEFKRRLLLTLDFLRDNQRPYWQAVAKEQTEVLNSIKE